jgi:hypothetical protein
MQQGTLLRARFHRAALADLLSIHPHRRRRADTQADSFSSDFHHDNADVLAYHDFLTDTSAQH